MGVERCAPRDALVGSTVADRYRIDGVLGRGGMGTVYAAVHLGLDRPVALKVLAEAWAHNAEALARFEQETKTASQLDHEHIVPITDVGTLRDGRPYLVMPRMWGIDLARYLERSGPLPVTRVVALLEGVAGALDLLHSQGVIHRDIKPSNLMWTRRQDGSERVQLLDFGIAMLTQSGARITRGGLFSGTPAYVAPEVVETGEADGRADVYSLATVAFEMLTGRLPFPSNTVLASLSTRVAREPPSLAQAGMVFDAKVERVISTGLARQRDARYGSASAFIGQLAIASGHADAQPEVPRSSGVMPRPGTSAGRPTRWLGTVSPRPLRPSGGRALSDASGKGFHRRLRRPALQRSWVLAAVVGIGALSWHGWHTIRRAAEGHWAPTTTMGRASASVGRTDAVMQTLTVQPPTLEVPRGVTPLPTAAPASNGLREPPRKAAGPRAAARNHLAASAALLAGDPTTATRLFRRAVRKDPLHAAAWRGLGQAQEERGQMQAARRAYARYLMLAPEAVDAVQIRYRAVRLETQDSP